MTSVDPEAIIDRLAGIDRRRPTLDPERVEAALAVHFLTLGMAPPPVRWLRDAEDGFLVAGRASASEQWAWLDRVSRSSTERAAGQSPAARRAWASAWPAVEAVAQAVAGRHARARAGRRGRAKGWTRVEFAARPAPRSAARAAVLLAAAPDPSIDRSIAVWLPFIDAVEGGLWLYWVLEEEVLAVPRPALRIEDGALHADRGPAVAWAQGARYWFWRGVEVPAEVVESPESITVAAIRKQRNVEVRRVMVERYGYQRYLRDVGAERVHTDDFGTLWRAEIPGDEPLLMVEVLDATPQPDGSFRDYLLRVPPWVRTAREAVAWTFARPPHEYRLDAET